MQDIRICGELAKLILYLRMSMNGDTNMAPVDIFKYLHAHSSHTDYIHIS